MGLPGTRSASPWSARVVSALPTAPADLSRALAISPVLQGPGWSVRYSATWRRSWPLPRRPSGAAGVVIGITSVKARRNIGRHWRAHAFRHYPGFNYPGEFPPVFPGTTRRYLAFFGGVNAFSPRIRGISARIPRNSYRPAAAVITVRRRAFSGRPAAFRPRLFPPAAGRHARPACLAVRPRGRAGAGPGRKGGGE